MGRIKAIIFDCFDVMVRDATKHALAQLDQSDASKRDEFRAVTRAVDRGILPDKEGLLLQSQLLGITPEAFIALRNKGEVRNEALLAYAASLRPTYRVAMLSNIASRARLDIRFLPGQLDATFDAVVASGDEGYIKPQPEIYRLVAKKLGVLPEECVMIDDIPAYCEGARAVGMEAIVFQSNEQCIAELSTLIDRGGQKV